jgi:hypothetical protein
MKFLELRHSPQVVAANAAGIYQAILSQSRCVNEANFRKIGIDDLELLFQLYDQKIFNNWLSDAVASTAGARLNFRLSSAMTRSGGKTIRRRSRLKTGIRADHYEIVIATHMLFMNFNSAHRPVTVSGLLCVDRLQALQRVMEHEMLHLLEFLAWGKSSCASARFRSMAYGIFGHTSSKHEMITVAEQASVRHAIRIGSRVEFQFDGRNLVGLVNRIRRRATVLVESGHGAKYSDGRKYQKYYVPIAGLKVSKS